MNWIVVLCWISVILVVVFILMAILALAKKYGSVYKNEPEQKNPLEGKRVVFVENENEPENADGVRGHLEAVKGLPKRQDFMKNT